jgi:hypothetical protein
MKKVVALLLTLIISTLLVLPQASAAIDFKGGLLDGRTSQIGDSKTISNHLTDDDVSTGITLSKIHSVNYYVHNRFDKIDTANITAYQLVASQGAMIKFFDANNREIVPQVAVPVIDGTITPISVPDVSFVQVYNSTGGDIVVYELNVYGETSHHEPFNLIAQSDATSINLTWNSDTYKIKKYKVLRSEHEDGVYLEIANNLSDTSYIDGTVEPGKKYFYKVVAYNNKGESDPSNVASATIPITDDGRAILVVTLTTGLEKEYDLSMQEVNAFIDWYEAKQAGSGTASYAIDKHDNNKGPFKSRKDYMLFDRILTFEVSEY